MVKDISIRICGTSAWAVLGDTVNAVLPLPSSSDPAPGGDGCEEPECARFSSADGLCHRGGLSALPFPRLLLLDAGGGCDAPPNGQEPEGGQLL